MRRRELLLSLATGMMGARAVRAQQKVVPVIGYLSSVSANRTEPLLATFRQGLGENGYVEGQNVALEYRWADGHYDRLPALAANLVGRKVDVIATSGGDPSALAAKSATSTIPIVSVVGADPVTGGLVGSFARPGGNLTGFSILNAELTPKRLELLCEIVPEARVIALLVNPNSPQTEPMMPSMQEGCVKLITTHLTLASSCEACSAFRGRDGHCWPPPAQIRTCPIKASGSYLGCLTSKRASGQG